MCSLCIILFFLVQLCLIKESSDVINWTRPFFGSRNSWQAKPILQQLQLQYKGLFWAALLISTAACLVLCDDCGWNEFLVNFHFCEGSGDSLMIAHKLHLPWRHLKSLNPPMTLQEVRVTGAVGCHGPLHFSSGQGHPQPRLRPPASSWFGVGSGDCPILNLGPGLPRSRTQWDYFSVSNLGFLPRDSDASG